MNAPSSSSPACDYTPSRTLVLIGMMGSGKTSVGRRLAARLGLPFTDADAEIETVSGMSISQLIKDYGEPEFRHLERRVMARLLAMPKHVLSTGGGAFMNEETRALVRSNGMSIWLKAETDLLLERALRHDNRPLLHGDNPRAIMEKLLTEREPIYAQADITLESDDRPLDETVLRLIKALKAFEANPAHAASNLKET